MLEQLNSGQLIGLIHIFLQRKSLDNKKMKPTIGLFLCFGAALIHASPGEYFSFK